MGKHTLIDVHEAKIETERTPGDDVVVFEITVKGEKAKFIVDFSTFCAIWEWFKKHFSTYKYDVEGRFPESKVDFFEAKDEDGEVVAATLRFLKISHLGDLSFTVTRGTAHQEPCLHFVIGVIEIEKLRQVVPQILGASG